MENLKKTAPGLLVCLALAVPSWFLGHAFPVIGGPVFAILAGMIVAMIIGSRTVLQPGIAFTSKKILQYAVILLGFGLNLSQIAKVGLFILLFVLASIITTIATLSGVDAAVFQPFKELSKFFIIWAMAAIGLNTDLIRLIKTGGKPIFMGVCCWLGITCVSLIMQHLEGLL